MMKTLLLNLSLGVLLGGCTLAAHDQSTIDITLPNTYSPAHLNGEWVNGYSSFTQVIDAYDGRNLGSAWQSGKYFKITENGKNSELYVMAKSQFSSFATKVTGTIRFDIGSTNESGSFTFLALKAHYRGWGSSQVNRAATEEELKNSLTTKYYYRMESGWLRIQAGEEVNEYTSSFKKISEP